MEAKIKRLKEGIKENEKSIRVLGNTLKSLKWREQRLKESLASNTDDQKTIENQMNKLYARIDLSKAKIRELEEMN